MTDDILTNDYLSSSKERISRLTGTMTFISALQINHDFEQCHKLHAVSSETRTFIEEHICRFDLDLYDRIGRDLDYWLSETPPDRRMESQ